MRRFYTCTHKSSRQWYLRLFWFLLDVAIDNAFFLESFRPDRTPAPRSRTNKDFRLELATELLGKFSSRQRSGRHVVEPPARLVQCHFSKRLGSADSQCVLCRREHTRKRTRYGCADCGNVPLCVDPCFRIYHTRSS